MCLLQVIQPRCQLRQQCLFSVLFCNHACLISASLSLSLSCSSWKILFLVLSPSLPLPLCLPSTGLEGRKGVYPPGSGYVCFKKAEKLQCFSAPFKIYWVGGPPVGGVSWLGSFFSLKKWWLDWFWSGKTRNKSVGQNPKSNFVEVKLTTLMYSVHDTGQMTSNWFLPLTLRPVLCRRGNAAALV